MKKYLLCCVAALLAFAANTNARQAGDEAQSRFVTVEDGHFMRDGKPYYYVGANLWYGAILGSEGTGGDRKRLTAELDSLRSIGVNNLRVLVGSDGRRGVPAKVEPTLQVEPGVYNDTIFAGLDYLLAEMGKRDMVAVLYLNNSWEWSGGYGQYLEWAGHGKAPVPAVDGWPAYNDYVSQYQQSAKAKALFARYVRDVITRTNRYTGVSYADDPTIMSWQIGNEPRAFGEKNKEAFAQWIDATAALIDSLAPRQLISTGSEGKHGCEEDLALFERIHAGRHIDYLNIHIWPYNWGWVDKDGIAGGASTAAENTKEYIDEHLAVAKKLGKPLVLEEFGYPRDGFKFGKDAKTTGRDSYYASVFSLIEAEARVKGRLAGCNFWAWGGLAEPSSEHVYWQPGDDYTGDPAQEEQGLNSVFTSDTSTLDLIRNTNAALQGF